MHILAATDFSTRSQRALRRAGLLARDSGAELTLVHVVDDDQPSDLVALERREAERILGEQIDAIPELHGLRPRALVVEGDPFDGILRAAASTGADLIVMGAHRKQLLRDILVGTTIERVIRTGPFPVLMVNKEVGSALPDGPGPGRPVRTVRERHQDREDPGASRWRPACARPCLRAAREGTDVPRRAQPGHHRRVRGR